MRHKCPVLTEKKWLKSVHIYGSYRKNKTGVPFFWTTLYKVVKYYCFSLYLNTIQISNIYTLLRLIKHCQNILQVYSTISIPPVIILLN